MRFLLIALTLTASTAWSQTNTLQLTLPNNETTLRLPEESCAQERLVNWSHNIGIAPCTDLRFWLTQGACSDEPSGTFIELTSVPRADVPNRRTGSVSFRVSQLPGFTSENPCPAPDTETQYKLCASVKTPGGLAVDCSSTVVQKDDLDIIYDAKPPAAPTIENVAALDQALSVRVSPPADASQVRLHVERVDGTGSRILTQSPDLPLFRVENLENGVTYRVTATAVDAADNESAASEPAEGTPIPTRGFFDRYVEAGGAEAGGCGAAGGGLLGGWVLAVLGFWLSSRRNRS